MQGVGRGQDHAVRPRLGKQIVQALDVQRARLLGQRHAGGRRVHHGAQLRLGAARQQRHVGAANQASANDCNLQRLHGSKINTVNACRRAP
jgi:hypothetical protein